jgi:hypothetical protein
MGEFHESEKCRPKPSKISLSVTAETLVFLAGVAGSVVRWYKRRKEQRNDRHK